MPHEEILERKFRPGEDIEALDLDHFIYLEDKIRARVDALFPDILGKTSPREMVNPSRFDKAMAAYLLSRDDCPSEITRKNGWICVNWLRAMLYKHKPPSCPPPDFFQVNKGVEPEDRKRIVGFLSKNLHEHWPEIMKEMPMSAFENPDKIEDRLREAIVDEGDPEILKFKDDRPGAWEVVTSIMEYHPDKIQDAREILAKVKTGELASGEAYLEYFKKVVPNHQEIISEMQRQGAQGIHEDRAKVNLE